jgi:hypothetical protein
VIEYDLRELWKDVGRGLAGRRSIDELIDMKPLEIAEGYLIEAFAAPVDDLLERVIHSDAAKSWVDAFLASAAEWEEAGLEMSDAQTARVDFLLQEADRVGWNVNAFMADWQDDAHSVHDLAAALVNDLINAQVSPDIVGSALAPFHLRRDIGVSFEQQISMLYDLVQGSFAHKLYSATLVALGRLETLTGNSPNVDAFAIRSALVDCLERVPKANVEEAITACTAEAREGDQAVFALTVEDILRGVQMYPSVLQGLAIRVWLHEVCDDGWLPNDIRGTAMRLMIDLKRAVRTSDFVHDLYEAIVQVGMAPAADTSPAGGAQPAPSIRRIGFLRQHEILARRISENHSSGEGSTLFQSSPVRLRNVFRWQQPPAVPSAEALARV